MTVQTSRPRWFAETARRAVVAPAGALVDGAGIGVLVGLTGMLDEAALTHWLGAFRAGPAAPGVSGRGQAGFAAGLAVAAEVEPRLAALAERTRAGVVRWGRELRVEPESLRWQDYDLIAGPAGVLLALTVAGRGTREELDPFATHLSLLAADRDVAGLRLGGYAEDPLRGWNQGSVNLGLGHGVPGVVVALAAARRTVGPRQDVLTALRHCATVLTDTAATDARGMSVWGAADRAPVDGQPRQAWCYGTPGVAWALWEAGNALADREMLAFATDAMTALDRGWDPEHELYGDGLADLLGVCHGAAGVLAVADAFARHAAHAPAARLRDRLADWLRGRESDVDELATGNLTLLDGAAGVLAVLHTVAGGNRNWLPLLGLR